MYLQRAMSGQHFKSPLMVADDTVLINHVSAMQHGLCVTIFIVASFLRSRMRLYEKYGVSVVK